MSKSLLNLSPQAIVKLLDKHIVGQAGAKRAVAIALRNRFRRMQVDIKLRHEITPKNILMVGPTGVGKTEIARRMAKLANAPFIKVEATKFTEVGYVGRDVDSIIRDLMEVSIKLTRELEWQKMAPQALKNAEQTILNVLLPAGKEHTAKAKNKITSDFKKGALDHTIIEIDAKRASIGVEIMAPPGMEEMTNQLQSLFQNLAQERTKKIKLKVKEALKLLQEEEIQKIINEDELRLKAIEQVEQTGIVFLDEIDKVAQRSDHVKGTDVSREGVQRDLLPLIEGCSVSTKYGMVRTDHILFIASGAFSYARPADLIPELQGRLPIRVELKALQSTDFVRILTEPDASLTEQYSALLKTEGIQLKFVADGIKAIAETAWNINERSENIGARRLHTVMEKLLEDVSYRASDLKVKTVQVNKKFVEKNLGLLAKDQDLSQFIL